jgi:predicted MPP superfamily phosphohydrolase
MSVTHAPTLREPLLRRVAALFPHYIRNFLALTALIHLPFVLVAREAAQALGLAQPLAAAAGAAACGTALFLLASRNWRSDYRTGRAAHLCFDVPYWVHWSACLLAGVPTLAVVGGWALLGLARDVRPPFPGRALAAVYLAALAVALYGTVVRRRRAVVREAPVRVHGLPREFEGYRIAQLSDLHVGSMTPARWAREWIAAANAMNPDLTVVTGDLVQSGNAFHDEVADALAELSAADGVYVSLGNHDYFGDAEALVRAVRARGTPVLRNEGVTLARGGGVLYLAALDDTWTRRDDLDRALAARPAGAPVVLLAHDPESFWGAAVRGVALTLSGHTHGGQMRVPGVPPMGRRLHLGRYLLGRATLVVHPGLGTTGPPTRLGVAPAILVHRLTAGDPAPAPRARRVRLPNAASASGRGD